MKYARFGIVMVLTLGWPIGELTALPGFEWAVPVGYQSAGFDDLLLPVFTEDPRTYGRKTDVVVDLIVKPNGQLAAVAPFYLPDRSFQKPVVNALKQSRCYPAIDDGDAVPGFMRYDVTDYFVLVDPEPSGDLKLPAPLWVLDRNLANQISQFLRMRSHTERVEIHFDLNREGQVTSLHAEDDVSKQLVDTLFSSAIEEMAFTPAELDGKAVPSRLMLCLDTVQSDNPVKPDAPDLQQPLPVCPLLEEPFDPVVVGVVAVFGTYGRLRSARVVDEVPWVFAFETFKALRKWMTGFADAPIDASDRSYKMAFTFVAGEPTASLAAEPQSREIIGPNPTRRVAPIYPYDLAITGTPGRVEIGFFVNERGRIVDAEVLVASHDSFGSNSLAAIREWRFKPGRMDGKRVDMRVIIPFLFWVNGHPGPKDEPPPAFTVTRVFLDSFQK